MPTSEQLKKQLLELGILTLVTVLIWIGYGVYNALTKPSQTLVLDKELRKVDTDLDLELIARVKERKIIDEDTLSKYLKGNFEQRQVSSPSSEASSSSQEFLSDQATSSASENNSVSE